MKDMNNHLSVKKISILGLATAVALAIYGLEAALPPLFPIPGMKLGLANLVTLLLLLRFGKRETSLVLLCRILMATFFFGSFVSLAYALAGGFSCLLIEFLLIHFVGKRYLPIISTFGALTHNMAQILVARLLTGTNGVFLYIPYLLLLGILTGLLIGFLAIWCNKHLPLIPAASQ